MLDLLLVNAYRYSGTDRKELIVAPLVDVSLGQGTRFLRRSTPSSRS